MRQGLSFSYLRDGRTPVVAVAIQVTPIPRVVKFQIATCGKKDSFNKSVARATTTGRLLKHPVTLTLPADADKHEFVLDSIVDYLVTSNFAGVHAGKRTRLIVGQESFNRRQAKTPQLTAWVNSALIGCGQHIGEIGQQLFGCADQTLWR